MFCNKCGRQIPAGTDFCQYCGAKVGQIYEYDSWNTVGRKNAEPNIWLLQYSIFDVLIAAFMGIIALMWLFRFFLSFRFALSFFSFSGGVTGIAGVLFYCLPLFLILALVGMEFFHMLKKEYILSIGVFLFVIAFFVATGSLIVKNVSNSYVTYGIFAPYGGVAGWTMFLSVCITGMLYSKNSETMK